MDEVELLGKIRSGGKARLEAVSTLYRRYARQFLGYFLNNRVPRAHADELVQDVFVNVVRHCEDFRGSARFDAWMWAIVRNTAIDYYRKERPEDFVDGDELEFLAGVGDGDSPRSEDLDNCVQKGYADFAAANPDRAEMLAKLVLEGWSTEEVAVALNRNPGATREYLSQCRKKLRPFLERCREFLGG